LGMRGLRLQVRDAGLLTGFHHRRRLIQAPALCWARFYARCIGRWRSARGLTRPAPGLVRPRATAPAIIGAIRRGQC
jgi:hypothetical protein